MEFHRLSYLSPLEHYRKQAQELLEGHQSADPAAIGIIHQNHPRFLDSRIPWLPRNLTESDIVNAVFDLEDAEMVIARWYSFADWAALSEYVQAVTELDSPVFLFESAVGAIITGDLARLVSLLREHPDLVRSRSTRRTHFDPPLHRATLLHYVAANGVEGYRQKTPPDAVEITTALLRGGAEVDALADMYGGSYATLSLLVSSCHPAKAGLQARLAETLLDFGAAIEGAGSKQWRSPLMTALAFGYPDTAKALVRRGARVSTVEAAAGLGRLDEVSRLLTRGDSEGRHRALALAAQHGHVDVVRLLLDSGEDPNRYNPEGNHAHSTPLHQAILAGHQSTVELLVERGARLDIKDTIYQGTPLGWAIYGGQTAIAEYLRTHGATD